MEAKIPQNIVRNIQSLFELVIPISRHPEAQIVEANEIKFYFSGSSFPMFNGVFCEENIEDIEQYFLNITQYFSEKHVPYVWWWLPQTSIPKEIFTALNRFGFTSLGNYSGVATQLDANFSSSYSLPYVVHEVTTNDLYQKFLHILGYVFQLNDEVKKDFYAMYQAYGPDSKFRHFIAYENDVPLATLSLYIEGKIAGFYNGATLPEAQRKGLCTALALHLINVVKEQNCEIVISQLMAPGMAKGVAEKLGAKTYCQMLPFVKM